MQNLRTSIDLTVELGTATSPSALVTLPLYLCRLPAAVTLKSTREYSVVGEFAYNSKATAYHSQFITFRGEFLANGSDCLGTGATGALLGHVVSPKEAGAYLKTFGGGLDAILSCARYATKTRGTFGKSDYELDGTTCEQPVFAGFTTGIRLAQSAAGRKPERFKFDAQDVKLSSAATQYGTYRVTLASVMPLSMVNLPNHAPVWYLAGHTNSPTDFGTAGPVAFANTSALFAWTREAQTVPCAQEEGRDPALAAAQLGAPLTPAATCALAGSVAALKKLERPAIAPAPSPPPRPTSDERMRIPAPPGRRPQGNGNQPRGVLQ